MQPDLGSRRGSTHLSTHADMQTLSRHHQHEPDSFETLGLLLEEMASTLKSQYLKSSIGDTKAILEVGCGPDRTEWVIESARETSGFVVAKTQQFHREKDADTFLFPSEPETVEYLVKEIVEKIVYCRYWGTEKDLKLKSFNHTAR